MGGPLGKSGVVVENGHPVRYRLVRRSCLAAPLADAQVWSVLPSTSIYPVSHISRYPM